MCCCVSAHQIRNTERVPLFFSLLRLLSLSRCYNKTNGTFPGGPLPLMHRVAPCQQDGLEMVPLGQVSTPCRGPNGEITPGDQEEDVGYEEDKPRESSPSQHSCCLVGTIENCPGDNSGRTFGISFILALYYLLRNPSKEVSREITTISAEKRQM